MALSTEQETLVKEAVDNLNKSVAVNQQVLELLRSIGAQGVVDVATHEADLNAHPTLNNLYITKKLIAGGSKTAFQGTTGEVTLEGLGTMSGTSNPSLGAMVCLYGTIDVTSNTHSYLAQRFILKDLNGLNFTDAVNSANMLYASQVRAVKSDNTSVELTHINTYYAPQYGGALVNIGIRGTPTDSDTKAYIFHRSGIQPLQTGSNFGTEGLPWENSYFAVAPSITSDARAKVNLQEIPEKVFKAWAKVAFKQYQLKEAIAEKGEDKARKHVGVIAQEIIAAFESEGLDACEYGIVCHKAWDDIYDTKEVEDEPAVVNENGETITPAKTHMEDVLIKAAGDQYTVRYEEALALECAYQRWRMDQLEAKLLETK